MNNDPHRNEEPPDLSHSKEGPDPLREKAPGADITIRMQPEAPAQKALSLREPTLAAGVRVAGRFRIEREIGRGGMGIVYLAHDERRTQPVALKFIHPRLLNSPQAQSRFIKEANICLTLPHRNIIRLYDVGDWKERGQVFLAMEYLQGVSLRQYLSDCRKQRRPLNWRTFCSILRQILSGIEEAHSQGVIHRDLKPANIMLVWQMEGEWRAVVMDFGLAKVMAPGDTRAGVPMGTFDYMAPEQRKDPTQVDARADLYSLGKMAYEMLTGELPEGQFDPIRELRSEMPEGIDAWLTQAMAQRPEKRFASAREMREALESIEAEAGSAPVVALYADSGEPAGAGSASYTNPYSGYPAKPFAPARESSSFPPARASSGYGEPAWTPRLQGKRLWMSLVSLASLLLLTIGGMLGALLYQSFLHRPTTAGGAPGASSGSSPPAPSPRAPEKDNSSGARRGQKEEAYWETAAGLSLQMIWIPGGTFRMGSPPSESMRSEDEGPVHEVTLDGFWMGETEVTQAQYQALMGKKPSFFEGADCPVERVFRNDVMEFCRLLSAKTNRQYTLPTEAQWEYACRAGSSSRFCFGDSEDDLKEYGWFSENANQRSHPVKSKRPNAWGLYDIHGNVWEWC
ncbi:MAG: SUMF1/EgtB/PvdO family nonheme iron enzyme, partial [Candidatus Sumerlaeota bacterium]|nr:SUMF1/EgtB/PvdO family nonheme iron enzyme [Candidatus Sumerlaeota bacterium]